MINNEFKCICYPLLLTVAVIVFEGCSPSSDNEPEPCTFTNPVATGQDPWVIKKDNKYYYIESRDGGLYVSESDSLTGIKKNEKKVWSQPETGWNRANLWAPELHFYDGKWYIYYAAGESGPPFIHQRSGVLESETDDALGGYVDKGLLYTGDNIEDESENIWSIDLTLLELDGQLYGIWSGWEENRDDDATPQHLYIAEMDNPWTISSNRVKISSPEHSWETGTELAINEGPQVLKHDGEVFVIYSASESWLPAYNLGQLRLRDGNADPMDPGNWEKAGPVFRGTEEVHGVGHASFTSSPDGDENWIVYHTKVSREPGWDRVVHMQPFEWNDDGTPHFGEPVTAGESVSKPSGECR
jgi:GH43 family beta-xylosidase